MEKPLEKQIFVDSYIPFGMSTRVYSSSWSLRRGLGGIMSFGSGGTSIRGEPCVGFDRESDGKKSFSVCAMLF